MHISFFGREKKNSFDVPPLNLFYKYQDSLKDPF